MSARALLFDFDGTIADTLEAGVRIWNEIAEEKSYRTVSPEELPELRHLSLKKLLKALDVPKRKIPGLLLAGVKRLRAEMENIELIEGLGPVLTELRPQYEIFGILTSNSVENVELFLTRHGLAGLFDFVRSSSKLTKKARHLTKILTQYDLEPAEAFYVGDEIRDMKASRKAGIPSVAVTWGFNSRRVLEATQPAHLVDKPESLLSLAG